MKSKEVERILKLKKCMTNECWLSSQLILNLEKEYGRLEERERILKLIDKWWAKRTSERKGGATFQELKDALSGQDTERSKKE